MRTGYIQYRMILLFLLSFLFVSCSSTQVIPTVIYGGPSVDENERVWKTLKESSNAHEWVWSMLNESVVEAYRARQLQQGSELALKAYQYALKNLGKANPRIVTSMYYLAFFYEAQGRYAEAEPLYKEVLQLCEKILGREDPSTINAAVNLAKLYIHQGRYSEAEPLLKETLELQEKVHGRQHPFTIGTINNLASLYLYQGRHAEAESLSKKTLRLKEKLLGREHPDTLMSINNLALSYSYQGRYVEAESLSKEALGLSEKLLGREHPDTLNLYIHVIGLMIKLDKIRPAFRELKDLQNRLSSRAFQELYSSSTGRIRRLYLKNTSLFQSLSFFFAQQQREITYQQFAANVLLQWKQVYTEEMAFQHRLLAINHEPDIVELKKNVGKLRSEFSRKIHQTKDIKGIQPIWQDLNRTEMEIRERARAFTSDLKATRADLSQVQAHLDKDSALIEYRIYTPLKTSEQDSPHLAGYLLLGDIDKDRQIYFEDLGEVTSILDAFSNKKEALYPVLLGRFEDQIKNLKKIYIAPDGFLHLISFAALRMPNGKYLAERHQINRLQTGRDLIASSSTEPDNILVAFGGVDYGKGKANSTVPEEEISKHYSLVACRELREGIPYLEQSLFEAQAIANIFKANCKEGDAIVYTGRDAVEGCLKRLARAPRVVHLSTHGFFLQNAHISNWAIEESPLLLSGLAMSGANNGLVGMVDKNGDDGFLYSIEVLGLNLQGTELVSLSACKTGDGVVDYSEGVYGLVQAFRTAGAKSVLMTLESVGDRDLQESLWKPSMITGLDQKIPRHHQRHYIEPI